MAKSNKKPAARSTRAASKPKVAAKTISRPVAKGARTAKDQKASRPLKVAALKPSPAKKAAAAPVKKVIAAPVKKAVANVAPAPVLPVKTKPGKNQAGLSSRELDHYRELLLLKRRELVGDMYSMEREALTRTGENLSNLPIHMADMGTDNYEQEFTLGLMEKDRQLLREINSALMKIMDGRYGICEGTGKPISKARLEVQPWARFSIEYARKLESRGIRG